MHESISLWIPNVRGFCTILLMENDDKQAEEQRQSETRAERKALEAADSPRTSRLPAVLATVALLAVMVAGGIASAKSEMFLDQSVEGDATKDVRGIEATASVPATTPAVVATVAPEPTIIEIGWVGDLTPGSRYGLPPDDGRALFASTAEYTQQPDLMMANLEGTFGNGGASKCDGKDSSDCYAFQAPPTNAAALSWAGIDVVNLANNHSNDYFGAGQTTTKEALDGQGIVYTGLGNDYPVLDVDGVQVAVLGFSPYSWSPSLADIGAAQAMVREADADADIVVVLMHAGAEGADKTTTPEGAEYAYGEFRGDSRAFSHAVIDAGADLVMGSGPHVVRGMEEYEGRLIAYSLGNFAGWKNFSRAGNLALSGLLTVEIDDEGEVLGGRWLSLRIVDPGVPQVDSSYESAALVRQLGEADFATPVLPDAEGYFILSTTE